MRSRIFASLSAVSLLLTLSSAVMWARSHFVGDVLCYDSKMGQWMFVSDAGTIWVSHNSSNGASTGSISVRMLEPGEWTLFVAPCAAVGRVWSRYVGNSWLPHVSVLKGQQAAVAPHGAVVMLAAVLPLSFLIQRQRIRRPPVSGMCISCGYDLRGATGPLP